VAVSEREDEPLELEDAPAEPADPEEDDDDEPRWGGEESLGLLPPD
jgi:hypothetical protein